MEQAHNRVQWRVLLLPVLDFGLATIVLVVSEEHIFPVVFRSSE